MMRATTVIFDIGKVLIDYDWDTFIRSIFSDEQTVLTLEDAFFNHGVWNELDRGIWTDEQLILEFVKYAGGYEEEIRYFYSRFGESLTQMPYAKDWIRTLKKAGIRVLYLSNYSEYAITANQEALDFIPLMDGGIFSYEVHQIKPEPEIYQTLLERFSLDPKECLFFDDREDNVETAKSFGINAFVFSQKEKADETISQFFSSYQ